LEHHERAGFIGDRIDQSLAGRLSLLAIALVAVFIAACGSTPESRDVPAAQPGATFAPADTTSTAEPGDTDPVATSIPSAPTSDPTSTRNPTSTSELIYVSDFELPEAGGGSVKLSDVYSSSNTALVFYRGYF
jgi:hypothetical protein|tara:strand:- start:947 stop:1345 length:399 start_codon:yes stop_codon:yes gene_type:complete